MLLDTALPLIVAGVAVLMDLRTAKVDNGWILFSLCTGCFYRLLRQGFAGLLPFFLGVCFPLLLLGILFCFRMLGPGDIKVFCVLGGLLGIRRISCCMLYALFFGGVLSLFLLLTYGDIRQRFHYFFRYIQDLMLTGEAKPYLRKGMAPENIHFTVPILMSILLYAGGFY